MRLIAITTSLLLTACVTVTAERRPIVSGEPITHAVVEHRSVQGLSVGQRLFSNSQVIIEAIWEKPGDSWEGKQYIFQIGGREVGSLEAAKKLFEVAPFFDDPPAEIIELLLANAEALRMEYDPFTNTRTFKIERYSSTPPLGLAISYGSQGHRLELLFHIRTASWVLFETVLVRAGKQTYTINISSEDRKVAGRFVEETARLNVGPKEMRLVEDLLTARTGQMRFVGNIGKRDEFLDEGHIEDLRAILSLYRTMIAKS